MSRVEEALRGGMALPGERRHDASEHGSRLVARGDLSALDKLDAEGVGVFCWSDVRPLAGPVGFLDWRMCGALSRTLESGFFDGGRNEVMLAPAFGRLRVRRVFAFGLGPSIEAALTSIRHVCRHAYDVMQRAGVVGHVLLAPTAPALPELERLFLQALDEELPGRIDLVLVERLS